MNKALKHFCRGEYDRFRHHLGSLWGVSERDLALLDPVLKPIHRRYLSLACASTIVSQRAQRAEHAKSIVEVSFLSMVLAVKGLESPACFLLRQSMELVLKHVYFSTHPVEYQWASTREGYRDLSFQMLLEYLSRTDEYRAVGTGHDLCGKMNCLYGSLSRHVHAQSRRFIRYGRAASSYRADAETLRAFERVTRQLWPILGLLLLVYSTGRFRRASASEQALVRSCLSKGLRDCLDRYLHRHS